MREAILPRDKVEPAPWILKRVANLVKGAKAKRAATAHRPGRRKGAASPKRVARGGYADARGAPLHRAFQKPPEIVRREPRMVQTLKEKLLETPLAGRTAAET